MSFNNSQAKTSSSTILISDKVIRAFEPVKSFSYHSGASITSLDFDDSGQFLISAGVDKSIQLYDVHKGIHQKDIQSQKYGAHAARFTHHELNCLYSSTPTEELDVDHAIRYLSLESNKYIRYFKGHRDQVTSIEVDPLRDVFLTSSRDRSVKLWDLRSQSAIGSVDVGDTSSSAFDPQGLVFAIGKFSTFSTPGNSKGSLSLYDMNNFDKGPFLNTELDIAQGIRLNKLEFSNTGKYILFATDSPEHYIIDAFSGKLLTILRIETTEESNINWMNFEYEYSGSACFSPCGKFAFVGSPSSKIYVFDLNSIRTTDGGNHFVDFNDNPPFLSPFVVLSGNQSVSKILAFNPKLLTLSTADASVSLWQPKY